MIQIMFNDEKIDVPGNIIKTKDIFKYVSSIKNIAINKLLLSINSHYVPYNEDVHLVDLGYSPDCKIFLTVNESKQITFQILPFKFETQKIVTKSTNAFEIKKIFSNDFFTVPRNIKIRYKDEILPDDLILFDHITDDTPIDVEVDETHILCHTYSDEFRFFCISKDSTLENIADTISIWSSEKVPNSIKHHYLIEDPNINIEEHLRDFKTLKFTRSQNKEFIKPFTISFSVIDNDQMNRVVKNFCFESFFKTNIYSLTVILERFFKIDRKLFIAFSKDDDMIPASSEINPKTNNDIKFKVLTTLKVKISDKTEHISYFSTIKDIQIMKHFDKHNFGIIVNNHFAFTNEANPFLINVLNDWEENENISEIKIRLSKMSCHEKRYTECSSTGEELKTEYFIIPDYMKPNDIFQKFLHKNFLSIQILDNKEGNIKYTYLSKQQIKINFISQESPQKTITIDLEGINPRVSDLLNRIFTKRLEHKIIKSNVKYQVFFDDKEIFFYTKLSDIYYTDNKLLTVIEKEMPEQIQTKIYDFSSSKVEELSSDLLLPTASEIICNLNREGNILYLDFNILNPNDFPTIYNCKSDFLIINKIRPSFTLTLTNQNITINHEFIENQYPYVAEKIKAIFGIENIPTKFELHYNKEKYELPSSFDCGSFPVKSKVFIFYDDPELKFITISYNKKEHLIPIPDSNVHIYTLSQQIMKSLNYYKLSERTFRLYFNGITFTPKVSFKYFKITQGMILFLGKSGDSFEIHVSAPNEAYQKTYLFSSKDTIFDLRQHLKEEFNYKESISITQPGFQSIDDNSKLVKDMKLLFYSVPITLQYQNTTFKIDHLLLVSEATQFIQNKIQQESVYIFKKDDQDDGYEILDDNKRLFEYESNELYLQRILPSIEFTNYKIVYTEDRKMSEQNTLSYFKKKFLLPITLMKEDDLIITKDKQPVDDTKQMKELILGTILNISIKDNNSESTSTKVKPSKSKTSKKFYVPKTTPTTPDHLKPTEDIQNECDFNKPIRPSNKNSIEIQTKDYKKDNSQMEDIIIEEEEEDLSASGINPVNVMQNANDIEIEEEEEDVEITK